MLYDKDCYCSHKIILYWSVIQTFLEIVSVAYFDLNPNVSFKDQKYVYALKFWTVYSEASPFETTSLFCMILYTISNSQPAKHYYLS